MLIGSPMRETARQRRQPCVLLLADTCRPLTTKARLTPVSGTTSQTVASATRSSMASRSGGAASVAARAASAPSAPGSGTPRRRRKDGPVPKDRRRGWD